jgi:triacylglycerol esterase/lipase EstA (alpha/beta hydrolase family)
MAGKSRGLVRWVAGGAVGMALALSAVANPPAGLAAPPAPQAAGARQAATGVAGTIYYGAIPPGGGTGKPVLVFVQGQHGQANSWWTNGNDMYNDAYGAGFRTAFVDLTDASGTGGSIWTNGQMLAGQLATITAHYGVDSVNVVAHSKGGLDTNAAIVHYGAGPRVQTLFQLASPNWGSQLADLSYSWWGGWLAAILGQRDDAVYSLQTGQMSYFRSVSDSRAENGYVHYATSAGTSHGSLFGKLWWGGAYLQPYGDNDGAVTLTSAHLPRGTHVFTDSRLDHDAMAVGHNTWSRVLPYAASRWRDTPPARLSPAPLPPVATTDPYAALNAADIIRGGPLAGRAVERFPVESGAQALNVAVLAPGSLTISLRAPDGRRYRPVAVSSGAAGAPLGTATQHIFQIAAPLAGDWQAEIGAAAPVALGRATPLSAYLLVAEIQSDLRVDLRRPAGPPTFAPGAAPQFQVAAHDGTGSLAGLQTEVHLSGDQGAPGPTTRQGANLRLALPTAPGVYNLSLTVRGMDRRGLPFERSLTTSFAVGALPAQP